MESLQDRFAPLNQCFGCGPKNSYGLRIKSFVKGESLVAEFHPKPHHQAFENVLSGGICGTLLDCHSNWCAAYFIMKFRDENEPPCTVTAHYSVSLLKPTPMDHPLTIIAVPREVSSNKAVIHAELKALDNITARCEGLFVAVKPGHPAYHRW